MMTEQTESNALVKLDTINIVELYTGEQGVKPLIAEIEKAARSLILDPTTEKGRSEIKSHAYQIAQAKTRLDNAGKALTEEWAKKKKQVDDGRKEIRDSLDALKDEIRKPVTEFEAAEAAKVEAARLEAERIERERIAAIEAENERLREAERQRIEAEQAAAAEKARVEAEERMKAEAAERARIKAEEAAAAAIAKAEQEKREAEEARIRAEEKAKLEAERAEQEKQAAIEAEREKARLEAERIENERVANEQRAKAEAERIEKERLAAEQKAREEEERRIANKKHRTAFNDDAINDLISAGLERDVAYKVVALIAEGKIAHVSITY